MENRLSVFNFAHGRGQKTLRLLGGREVVGNLASVRLGRRSGIPLRGELGEKCEPGAVRERL